MIPSGPIAVLTIGLIAAACGDDRPSATALAVGPGGPPDSIVFTGTIVARPLSLAALEARAAGLPACGSLPAVDTARLRATRLRPLPRGTLWLPPDAVDRRDDVPDTTVQTWRRPDESDLTVMMSGGAGASTGYGIAPDDERVTTVGEPACALRVAGRATRVDRSLFVARAGPGTRPDTEYIATGDVPVAFDSTLGFGVVATTRAGRDTLLASLLSVQLAPR